jgi:hypothetical protein
MATGRDDTLGFLFFRVKISFIAKENKVPRAFLELGKPFEEQVD